MLNKSSHTPVLLHELVDHLCLQSGQCVIDCTFGGGGHARDVLAKIGPTGKLIGFDRDHFAIERAKKNFQKEISQQRLTLVHASYSEIYSVCQNLGLIGKIQAVYADLGVSSDQIDTPQRGFSFQTDGPLDMRLDQSSEEPSAADVVNTLPEKELCDVLRKYGEEEKAYRIAKIICERRTQAPITSTLQLARIINSAVRYKTQSKKNPATKTFQALRIFVNKELEDLEHLLNHVPEIVAPRGRFAVVSFHSLEDRIVKQRFVRLSQEANKHLPRDLPILAASSPASFKIIKPFPINPSDEEAFKNPRARSAHLRVLEKC